MKCSRCQSQRIIRFIDGFGSPRMFCRSCHKSVRVQRPVILSQSKIMDFNERWGNERIKEAPGNFTGR